MVLIITGFFPQHCFNIFWSFPYWHVKLFGESAFFLVLTLSVDPCVIATKIARSVAFTNLTHSLKLKGKVFFTLKLTKFNSKVLLLVTCYSEGYVFTLTLCRDDLLDGIRNSRLLRPTFKKVFLKQDIYKQNQ